MERGILPSYSILAVTAVRRQHLVKCSHLVSLSKGLYAVSYRFHVAGDVITLVPRTIIPHLGHFPVLWVGARHHNADEDLAWLWRGDGDIVDGDRGGLVNHCFLHGGLLKMREVWGRRADDAIFICPAFALDLSGLRYSYSLYIWMIVEELPGLSS